MNSKSLCCGAEMINKNWCVKCQRQCRPALIAHGKAERENEFHKLSERVGEIYFEHLDELKAAKDDAFTKGIEAAIKVVDNFGAVHSFSAEATVCAGDIKAMLNSLKETNTK